MFGFGKNVITLPIEFSIDNRSSLHTNNSNQNILVIGKRPIQGLDNTTIAT